jgi:signal transduction histidine kinase
MEDALLINAGNLAQFGIRIKRDYADQIDEINIEKHKLLQILINLISNARHACRGSNRNDKEITLQIKQEDGKLKMSVHDNGIGIAPENLTRIFSHGFTTRKDGHGFGLHSGALAASQLGGRLTVRSDGRGCGACFTVELPLDRRNRQAAPEPMEMELHA